MILDSKVICFIGDSITANGLWMAEVFEHLASHYPEKKILMYNCGVAGDSAVGTLKRLDSDVLRHHPDTVTIMLGVNDIGRHLYGKNCTEPDAERQKEERLARHAEAMEAIVRRMTDEGIRVILCTTVPYDDYTGEGQENLYCTEGLLRCRAIALGLAEKYGAAVVDFMTLLTPMLPEGIIRDDRVHPTVVGYHRMAEVFLREVGLNPDGTDDFCMNPQNQRRYEVESLLRNFRFIELWHRGKLGENASVEACKAECMCTLPPELAWLQDGFRRYVNCIDDEASYDAQLEEETAAMYAV